MNFSTNFSMNVSMTKNGRATKAFAALVLAAAPLLAQIGGLGGSPG